MLIERLSEEELEAYKPASRKKTSKRKGSHKEPAPDAEMPHTEEWDLVRRTKELDPAAFGEIYKRYYNGILGYIYYRCGDAMLAEDLTGEVFFRAGAKIHTFSFKGVPFSAWLYQIASNLLTDHYRRSPSKAPLSLEEKLVAGVFDGPGDTFERSLRHAHLTEALSLLTDEQRTVIQLKYAEGLPNLEVGQIMGKTEGAIKSLQHRALASLGRFLGQIGFEYNASVRSKGESVQPKAKVDEFTASEFSAALFREEGHPALLELTDPHRNVEKAQEANRIFRDIIVPKVDLMSGQIRRMLFAIFFEGMTVGALQKRLGADVDVKKIINATIDTIRQHVREETGYEDIELEKIFRSTRASLLLFSPKVHTGNIRYMRERPKGKRGPHKPKYSYLLSMSTPAVERVFGSLNGHVGDEEMSDEQRLRMAEQFLDSTVTMLVDADVQLEGREGAHVIVHNGRITAQEIIQPHKGEFIRNKGEFVHVGKPGMEAVVGEHSDHVGVGLSRYPSAKTASRTVATFIHPEAHTSCNDPQEHAQRRQDLLEWYADVTRVRPIGRIEQHVVTEK